MNLKSSTIIVTTLTPSNMLLPVNMAVGLVVHVIMHLVRVVVRLPIVVHTKEKSSGSSWSYVEVVALCAASPAVWALA